MTFKLPVLLCVEACLLLTATLSAQPPVFPEYERRCLHPVHYSDDGICYERHHTNYGLDWRNETYRRTYLGRYAPTISFKSREYLMQVGMNGPPQDLQAWGKTMHERVAVTYGNAQDGIPAERLIAFLQDDILAASVIRRWGETPPTVRILDGATSRQASDAVMTVAYLNASLPPDWQMETYMDPPSTLYDGFLVEGEIHVDLFTEYDPDRDGLAVGTAGSRGYPVLWAGSAWVDSGRTESQRRHVLTHELLHTMGRGHQTNTGRFPDTIMWGVFSNGGLPSKLDQDALLAVYGWLAPGDTAKDIAMKLRNWEDTSFHLIGEAIRGNAATEHIPLSFGLALRNGVAKPWAFGPSPWEDYWTLGIKTEQESHRWEGRALGFTRDGDPVAGGVKISSDKSNFDLTLEVHDLEYWPGQNSPGEVGTGKRREIGHLRSNLWQCDLSITINEAFSKTWCEALITAAFYGPNHEGIGGVMEMDGLTLAFGVVRWEAFEGSEPGGQLGH